MTHTPRPWKYHIGTCITTDERDPQTIAYLSDHRNRKPRPEAETISNGHLIAAAPELLEACKYGHNTSEGWEWEIYNILAKNNRDLADLFAGKMRLEVVAITQAEGECDECGGTGTVIVTSSPGLPEHGSIEQESCSKCNGGAQ